MNENERLGGRQRRQSPPQPEQPAHAPLSRRHPDAAAGHHESARHERARSAPVVGAVWRDAAGQRLRIKYVTRESIEFLNLHTDGYGLMSRAWLEKHFTEEEAACA